MDIQANIERFEYLATKIERPGMDRLMNFIRQSDFYRAPSSTRFHLSVEGGLLQHSLNVYDALITSLKDNGDDTYSYKVKGFEIARMKHESIIMMSLFHDICKTYFYAKDYKNQKTYDAEKVAAAEDWQKKKDNNGEFIWETIEVYTVEDKIPYGHGEKSVMMIEEFVKLLPAERYAIRWHMGHTDVSETSKYALNEAFKMYPKA